MKLRRRALPLLALSAFAAPARADTIDLSLACDTTLAPAMRKVAAAYNIRTGVHVFVFPTGPGLILPQLQRDIQNDIVVTQTSILDQAAQDGIVARPVSAQWRNPIVIGGLRAAAAIDGVFAATDPSPAADFDGPELLQRLSVRPTRVLGAVDTDEVAFLLTTGAAQAGLLHSTDLNADGRLELIQRVPAEVQAPLRYAASVTRLARRPNPEGFVAFLAGREAAALLAEAGLEPAS